MSKARDAQLAVAQLEAVIDNYSGVIWSVNKEGIITTFRGQYLAKIGVTPEFLEGKPLNLARGKNRHFDIMENVEKALLGERQDWTGEIDGAIFRTRISPVYEDGEITSVMGSTDDLTDLMTLQRDLESALEEAQVASKAKSEFLSNMSHEIRTPMNAIIGLTKLGKAENGTRRKDEAFSKIESAGEHLLGIINDILDISEIEEGKYELAEKVFSPALAIRKAYDIISPSAVDKVQNYTLHITEDIPEMLLGDENKFTQVVTNLLSNAVKFTPERGAVRLKADYGGESEDGRKCITVSVTDTGIGMEDAQIATIFNAFEQADNSASRRHGGTGLGLAISKHIAVMMGGDITVSSRLGEGSTFFVKVYFKPTNLSVEDASSTYMRPQDFSNHSILLAEDNEINREIVIALLEPSGINIDCAVNGKDAVEKFKANYEKYDLIFMDIQMPEMTGLEATRKIRSLEPPYADKAKSIPIVAMTANVFKEDVELCLEAGMDDHLSKPLDFTIVFERLAHYLDDKSGKV